jgi:hypothetical protein
VARHSSELDDRAMVSSAVILDELVDQITARAKLYRSCLVADLRRLEAKHGTAALEQAMVRIEQNEHRETWDAAGHRDAVANAVAKLTQRWHTDPENFPDGCVKV